MREAVNPLSARVSFGEKALRFAAAGVLVLFLHFCLTAFAGWVQEQTVPPNISPDAGQNWMQRHYVPAYPNYSAFYAAGILLAGNIITAIGFYLLGRTPRVPELLAVAISWALAGFCELVYLFLMLAFNTP
ncbi:hypothetical protein [Hymenobacter properus]|uniref:Uncharacterized protein n=1 Tax=Hymenobacter properus TaxID=2791026 RepID=A0A931BFR5_9BACT|nr:hypothetical protein [Hymenobacter properus]MBF9143090.1 hypothetical protein [Hymenobacter properus]MBR7721898.1 hypothetical protein [Microvirga sp. SRT04]